MNESVIKTIGVAFAVCLVCSLIVSVSAVSLREQQKENKLNDRRVKILEVADIKIEPNQTVAEAFNKLEQKFIDFNTGKLMDEYKNFKIDDYDLISQINKPMIINELGGNNNRLLPIYHSGITSLPNRVPAPKSSLINATAIRIKL